MSPADGEGFGPPFFSACLLGPARMCGGIRLSRCRNMKLQEQYHAQPATSNQLAPNFANALLPSHLVYSFLTNS